MLLSWKDKDLETEEFLALFGLEKVFTILLSLFFSLYRIRQATNSYCDPLNSVVIISV